MIQNSNMFAAAVIGWIGQGSCHGFMSGSGISGMSISTPLNTSRMWSIELRDCSFWVISITWALRMLFSDSSWLYCPASRSACVAIRAFSSLSFAPWFIRSSRCCCFLIRDRLADSRFESILFLFLSSIRRSPSDPDDWLASGEGIIVPKLSRFRAFASWVGSKLKSFIKFGGSSGGGNQFMRRHRTSRGIQPRRSGESRRGGPGSS